MMKPSQYGRLLLELRLKQPFTTSDQGIALLPESFRTFAEAWKNFSTIDSPDFGSPQLAAELLAAVTWVLNSGVEAAKKLRPELKTPFDLLEDSFLRAATDEDSAAYLAGTFFDACDQTPEQQAEALKQYVAASYFKPLKAIAGLKRSSPPSFRRMTDLNRKHFGAAWIDHNTMRVGSRYEAPGKIDGARLWVIDAIRDLLPDAQIDLATKVFYLEQLVGGRVEDAEVKVYPEELESDVVRVTVQRRGITGTRDFDLPASTAR